MPQHEPEVQRAINRKLGHVWVLLPPAWGNGQNGTEKGTWYCETCGLKVGQPRVKYGHENEKCPGRKPGSTR